MALIDTSSFVKCMVPLVCLALVFSCDIHTLDVLVHMQYSVESALRH